MTPPPDLSALFTTAKAGGPSARTARDELITIFYDKIVRRVGAMLHTFPAVRKRREVDSVANDLVLKLDKLFDDPTISMGTEAEFFKLASTKLRRLLLDEVLKYRRHNALLAQRSFEFGVTAKSLDDAAANDSCTPESLEEWERFHAQIAALPEDERTAVQMHTLMGLSQAEAARILDVHPRTFSRTYQSAMLKLSDYLPTVG